MDLKEKMKKMAGETKKASFLLALCDSETKNQALKEMARSLTQSKSFIIKANEKDLKNAKKIKLSSALTDRLKLDEKRINGMVKSIEDIIEFEDIVGSIGQIAKRPNGLLIGKMRVPLGVILIIYESRPNVTSDCMALCLKSGNGIILRGGTEAINSNIAIFDVLNRAATKKGIPKNAFNIVNITDRKAVDILLSLEESIDVVIPRGGESLIREIAKRSKIPVIKHYKGVCHVYVDGYADLNMAERIAYNAKVQRPGVCNAMETLLVHKDVASRFLPSLAKKLKDAGVELRGCAMTKKILRNTKVKKANESDWYAEYLDLILSVRVVGSLEEAVLHIAKYGTAHSDAIVTENHVHAMEFLRKVDSSAVYINASTRFTDGYEFGKGAEIGISTGRLHARGPVGLEELTTYKYVVFGNGQVRE